MLGWFKRRRLRRRMIFAYSDGQRRRHADAVTICRRLQEYGGAGWVGSLFTLRELYAAGSDRTKAKHQLTDFVLDMIRTAFDVRAIGSEGEGLTEAETIDLLGEYMAFMDACRTASEKTAGQGASHGR